MKPWRSRVASQLVLEPPGPRLTVGDRELLGELALEPAGVTFELLVPARAAAHDADLAADPLPSGRRHETPVGAHRRRREQRHDVVTVEVAVGEREQREQRATEHALGQGADRGAVVRDARGSELLVDEPRVRLVGAEQDRHAIERHAVAQRVDDHADDGADFVVGVRHRHDARALRDVGAGAVASTVSPSRASASRTPASARATPDTPATTTTDVCADAASSMRAAAGAMSSGRYTTIAPRSARPGCVARDLGDRGIHEVGFVVPRRRRATPRTARPMRTRS